MLVALGEVEPRVLHVRARLGGDDVERLLGQVAAEVDRHPLDAGVAADLDAPRGEVVDLAAAPVLVVGEVDLGARVRVQLEGARVQRLALEVGAEEVLADAGTRRARRPRRACAPTAPCRARRSARRPGSASRPWTFFGTWMNTPPVQNAAVPAANLPSSWGRRLAKCSARPARCSSTACSSGITVMRSSATSVWTTLAPRWTISAACSSSPRSRHLRQLLDGS